MKFPIHKQLDSMDCGPSCLRMIAAYHGKKFTLEYLKELTSFSRTGVSLKSIMDAADKIGLETMAVNLSYDELINQAPKPCILHWEKNHFVVLPPQNEKKLQSTITVIDPASGKRILSVGKFKEAWLNESNTGIALLLHPTDAFYNIEEEPSENGLAFLWNYLKKYKRTLIKVLLTLVITSILTLIFPLLTQALVDRGIQPKNRNFVLLVLVAQIVLFLGNLTMEIVRSWLVLHMNTKIIIQIISDFIVKLMRLPLRFFEARRVGDIQQRILDYDRIRQLLSGHALATLFSFVNFIVFSVILAIYNFWILLIFIVMSAISVLWILRFLSKRKELDILQFSLNSKNQNMLNEMVSGMPEIKLNSAENLQREKWESIQTELYKRNTQSLKLEQYQQAGSSFFTQLKNILITCITALAVIEGDMTLGMMLAVSFIIGQMNAPLDQILSTIQLIQDGKLSLERLSEVHQKEEEVINREDILPAGNIVLKNVSFSYDNDPVLKDINCTIERGKTTAIVGSSGSGKTTLLKLLLQFYHPQKGNIYLGDKELQNISLASWRQNIGVVLQDGFIFSDTLIKNVTMLEENPDMTKFAEAVRISNLNDLIEKLPLAEETHIGNNGTGLSAGQKQRILIARAVYKDPEFIFFDEATSALDAKNEREIIANLENFYKNKTVLIIAHRLSTVKSADNIIVLNEGKIAETGNHLSLTEKRGKYYELIRNQLEMG